MYEIQEFLGARGGKWYTMRRCDTLEAAREWAAVFGYKCRIVRYRYGKALIVPKVPT